MFSFLLAGVGVLLVVAPLAGVTIATGVQLPLGALAVMAIGLLLAAFLYASVVYGEAYVATLWATAPFLPAGAAVGVFVAYFALPWTSPGMPHEASLYLGLGAALAVWIVSAAPLRGLACVETAQTYSYGWLKQRTRTLAARIEALDAIHAATHVGQEPAGETPDSAPAAGARQGERSGWEETLRKLLDEMAVVVYRAPEAVSTTSGTAADAGVALDKALALRQAKTCLKDLKHELGIPQEPSRASGTCRRPATSTSGVLSTRPKRLC